MQPNPAPLTPAELELKSEALSKGMATVPSLSLASEQAHAPVRAAAHGAVTPESRGTAGSAHFQHRDNTWPLCDIKQQPWTAERLDKRARTNSNSREDNAARVSQRNKPTTEQSEAF